MSKKLLFVLVASCLVTPVFAQEKWDLRRSVEYALQNNISVRQADLQSRFSGLDLERNRLSQYPNLNFQSNVGYRFGRSENPATGVLEDNNFLTSGFQLQSNVTLFNWFSTKYTIQASRLNHEADKAQVKKVQDDIALNVAVAYLQVLLAKEQANLSAIQVAQTAVQLDVTRRRVKAGALPEINSAELEAQLARDSANLIGAQSQVQQLLLQMKALLNLDASVPFDVVAPPVQMIPVESLADLQPEYVFGMAVKNLPQQKVNDLRLQSNQQAQRAAKGAMYPVFSGYAGLGSNYVSIPGFDFLPLPGKIPTGATVTVGGTEYEVVRQAMMPVEVNTPYFRQVRNNFSQNIGIGMSVPIFNGGNLRTAYERSKLFVHQSQLEIERSNQSLKQDIYKAYNDAVTAIERYNANRKSVEAAQKAYDFARKRYDLNLLSTFDLLNSQNNLLRARAEMVYAQFDYVFKMKLLEFYKGQGLKL